MCFKPGNAVSEPNDMQNYESEICPKKDARGDSCQMIRCVKRQGDWKYEWFEKKSPESHPSIQRGAVATKNNKSIVKIF